MNKTCSLAVHGLPILCMVLFTLLCCPHIYFQVSYIYAYIYIYIMYFGVQLSGVNSFQKTRIDGQFVNIIGGSDMNKIINFTAPSKSKDTEI